jgi:perosamine synthetase
MSNLALLGGPKTRTEPYPPHPVIGAEERELVAAVLDSGQLSGFIASAGEVFLGGPMVRRLEADICDYLGVKHAVAVNSATAGLHCACAALELGPGDEVIVPPYTMSASATAILMTNAIPVFADIEPDMFCIDPESIRARITPRTKAIVVVHLYGMAADMDAIMAIAREHDLKVIEDCAQSPGASYKGRRVGTIGDLGVFSFNQHKTVTTGEGGFVVTGSEAYATKAQLVRNHGEVIAEKMGYDDIVDALGWNYRITELEAAVGIGQWHKLDMLTEHRVRLAKRLESRLKSIASPALQLPPVRSGCDHVYFLYAMRFDAKAAGVSRQTFIDAMLAEGVPMGAGYVRPIYLEPAYQRLIGYGDKGCPFTCPYYEGVVDYSKGICPVCEDLYESRLVSTAICRYPLSESDVDDVANAFEKVLSALPELAAYEAAQA